MHGDSHGPIQAGQNYRNCVKCLKEPLSRLTSRQDKVRGGVFRGFEVRRRARDSPRANRSTATHLCEWARAGSAVDRRVVGGALDAGGCKAAVVRTPPGESGRAAARLADDHPGRGGLAAGDGSRARRPARHLGSTFDDLRRHVADRAGLHGARQHRRRRTWGGRTAIKRRIAAACARKSQSAGKKHSRQKAPALAQEPGLPHGESPVPRQVSHVRLRPSDGHGRTGTRSPVRTANEGAASRIESIDYVELNRCV